MADHGPNSTSNASSTGSIFSRRPSLFAKKGLRSRTSTPPQIVLPTVSIASPSEADGDNKRPQTADRSHQPDAPIPPTTPPRRKHSSRHSIASSVAEVSTSLRRSRSASLRTNASGSSSHKRTPSATLALALPLSPEKPAAAHAPPPSRPTLSISTFSRSGKQKSAENVKTGDGTAKQGYEKSPLSAVDNPKTPFAMAVPLRYPPSQKEIQMAQRQNSIGAGFTPNLGPAAPVAMPSGANPNVIFQHIHELASKRISTLDYLRKAHEGRIYWFNTLLFSKSDLTRLPSFTPRNLARRATNYLLLGFSLPTILDLNANSPTDYLKALNALLLEFETYQSIHPSDGTTPSSLSRARIPQMFKGRSFGVGGKGRRSSSAAGDFQFGPGGVLGGAGFETPREVDVPPDDVLLPNESYTYLQTPSLPFDPDFFSTFATLCDVLIDSYTKILSMLATPESVVAAGGGMPSAVGDLFGKADARVRKIILAGVVREFEESCRLGVKSEVGGVGRVVLGGMM